MWILNYAVFCTHTIWIYFNNVKFFLILSHVLAVYFHISFVSVVYKLHKAILPTDNRISVCCNINLDRFSVLRYTVYCQTAQPGN